GLGNSRKRTASGGSAAQPARSYAAATSADSLTSLLRPGAGRGYDHTALTGICPIPAQETLRAHISKLTKSVERDACQFFYVFTCAVTWNEMIGLGWRDKTFGPALTIVNGKVVTIALGSGMNPGHGPRHDFQLCVLKGD